MGTITASSLTGLVGDTTMAAADAERIIMQAINELNLHLYRYDLVINQMTGTAGTRSWTGTNHEEGAIISVAMEYYQYYKTSGSSATSVNVSGLGYSSSTSTGGGMGRIHEVAEKQAEKLVEIDISVG